MEFISGEPTEPSEQTLQTEQFTMDPYCLRINKPWGYEEHLVPPGKPYMLKRLVIDDGARLSLQSHDKKEESWTAISGRVAVVWENDAGELVQTELQPGQGYGVPVGRKHRLVGVENAVVMEASTEEKGTTTRYEDDWDRPDETPEQRELERSQ